MKTQTAFACSTCGYASQKWFGRCPDCGDWSTAASPLRDTSSLRVIELGTAAPSIPACVSTGIAEVDRALGGLVPGEVLLLTGEPGIGKSTLVLQVLTRLRAAGLSVLLGTGEETVAQIAARAQRLSWRDAGDVAVTACSSTGTLAEVVAAGTYDVVAIDSVQTLRDESVDHGSGSVTQVRESVLRLAEAARRSGTILLLIGHVTKDGSVAGPKILEHVVDAVVSLEGVRGEPLRFLRALKNRYGSCDETGVFEMTHAGLAPLDDPSNMLLADRSRASGTVVFPSLVGSRPLLVEVQALVADSELPQPRRVALGVEQRRLTMALAVVAERLKLTVGKRDVFVAVAGGVVVREPAIDLALVLALLSAIAKVAIGEDVVAFGELGLAGEFRRVQGAERRLSEARRLGFRRALVPPALAATSTLRAVPVRDVHSALAFLAPDAR
ncbi:MAG TPA: ATPase domain-containing protein [Actinomycetota bacterium]|nr:ATPase domain-containing protein [Actinomycetota bacterium]